MAFPYELAEKLGTRATLGLIVLQTDGTIEHEFRRYFASPDIALYVTRVPSGADVTPTTLAAMAEEMPNAAALLPPSQSFDCIGYACTSGATVIGPERVESLIKGAADTGAVSNPITSVIAALQALQVKNLAMVTPYIESVTGRCGESWKTTGLRLHLASVSMKPKK